MSSHTQDGQMFPPTFKLPTLPLSAQPHVSIFHFLGKWCCHTGRNELAFYMIPYRSEVAGNQSRGTNPSHCSSLSRVNTGKSKTQSTVHQSVTVCGVRVEEGASFCVHNRWQGLTVAVAWEILSCLFLLTETDNSTCSLELGSRCLRVNSQKRTCDVDDSWHKYLPAWCLGTVSLHVEPRNVCGREGDEKAEEYRGRAFTMAIT